MQRYGKIVVSKLDESANPVLWRIDVVIESESQPGIEFGEWVLCGNAGPGWTTIDRVTFTPN